MSEKLSPSSRESVHPDGLDIRLKKISSFNNSLQNKKDNKKFF